MTHVHQIIKASETMKLTSTIVEVVTFPSNEAQCRELSAVPKDKVAEVWMEVVKKSEAEGTQITAKLIRSFAEKYVPKDEGLVDKPAGFDLRGAGDRLCDWLRAELERWPEKHRPEAAHWVRQILQKEFSL